MRSIANRMFGAREASLSASCFATSVATMLLGASVGHGYSSGIGGYSGNPATNPGLIRNSRQALVNTPTVTILGPGSVAPRTSHTRTLTITGGRAYGGGLDVSASAGSLRVVDQASYSLPFRRFGSYAWRGQVRSIGTSGAYGVFDLGP